VQCYTACVMYRTGEPEGHLDPQRRHQPRKVRQAQSDAACGHRNLMEAMTVFPVTCLGRCGPRVGATCGTRERAQSRDYSTHSTEDRVHKETALGLHTRYLVNFATVTRFMVTV